MTWQLGDPEAFEQLHGGVRVALRQRGGGFVLRCFGLRLLCETGFDTGVDLLLATQWHGRRGNAEIGQ